MPSQGTALCSITYDRYAAGRGVQVDLMVEALVKALSLVAPAQR